MEFNFRDLPYAVKRIAFNQMNTLEKICYSLQSARSKQLIQPLIPRANEIEVALGSGVTVQTDTKEFAINIQLSEQNHATSKGPIPMPISVRARNPLEFVTPHSLDHPEFSVRNWIDFLKDVLRCNSIKLMFSGPSAFFTRESIMETFRGLDISGFDVHNCPPDRTRWYLNKFPPTKSLKLFRNPYDGPLPDLFRREFHSLHLILFNISMSDILLLNSQNIQIDSQLSGNDCNRFLKEWIQGSNPGLQTMLLSSDVRCHADNVIQEVMDGIAHSVLPNDYEISRSGIDGIFWTVVASVIGVYQIEANDGRKAAIKIDMMGPFFNMRMVVL